MNKKDQLLQCLSQLEDINYTLNSVAETLKDNSLAIHQVMDEIMNGEEPFPSELAYSPFHSDHSIIEDGSDMESLAEKIIQQMEMSNKSEEPMIHGISIMIDPDKIDPEKLMKLIDEKINIKSESESSAPKKEDVDDEISFDNPLE